VLFFAVSHQQKAFIAITFDNLHLIVGFLLNVFPDRLTADG
jgi:hypothetical protein